MKIVIDSREQNPFPLIGFQTERRTLETGDYSLSGFESLVAVERKSKEDAYGCVSPRKQGNRKSGRARFTECLERLSLLARAAIVIECGMSEFMEPPAYTQINGPFAIASYLDWSCKYALPVYWCDGGRAQAERVTVRFLAAYLKHVDGLDNKQHKRLADVRICTV